MNRQQYEDALRNYHWMIKSIDIMRQSLEAAGENITARYGIESAMPTGKGQAGDPIFRETIRRSKHWEKVERYEKQVKAIQSRMHVIEDDRETEVLHWMLEGKSYSWIARHMDLSERHIRRLKDIIIDKMLEMPKTPNKPDTTKKCAS